MVQGIIDIISYINVIGKNNLLQRRSIDLKVSAFIFTPFPTEKTNTLLSPVVMAVPIKAVTHNKSFSVSREHEKKIITSTSR